MARCIRQVRPWEQYGSIHSTIRSLGSHRSSRALSKTFQMYRIMFAPNDQIVECIKPCLRLPKINITNASWSIQQSVVNDQTRRTDRAVFGPRNKHVKCFEPLVVPRAKLSNVSGRPSSQGSCGRVCRKMLSHCASQGFLALVCNVSLCLPLIRLATYCFSIAVIASALLSFLRLLRFSLVRFTATWAPLRCFFAPPRGTQEGYGGLLPEARRTPDRP